MKDNKLKSKDFFNVKDDPYITFHSTKVVQTSPTTFDVQGTSTIRGVSKDETLSLTLNPKEIRQLGLLTPTVQPAPSRPAHKNRR